MSIQQPDEIVRYGDGAIDINFYARRGIALRRAAKAALMARIGATIGGLFASWAGAARRGGRRLMRRLRFARSGPGGRREAERPVRIPADLHEAMKAGARASLPGPAARLRP